MSKFLEEIKDKRIEGSNYTLYDLFNGYVYMSIIYSVMFSKNYREHIYKLLKDDVFSEYILDNSISTDEKPVFNKAFLDALECEIGLMKERGIFTSENRAPFYELISIYYGDEKSRLETRNKFIRILNGILPEKYDMGFMFSEIERRFLIPVELLGPLEEYESLRLEVCKSMQYDLSFIKALISDNENYFDGTFVDDYSSDEFSDSDFYIVSLFSIMGTIDELNESEVFCQFAHKIICEYENTENQNHKFKIIKKNKR